MKKLSLLFLILTLAYTSKAQNCEKGCGKITKVEPTTMKGVKPDRALLIFKFYGADGKPAKSHINLILDNKDTLHPKIDKMGASKLMVKPGNHSFKFKANYWYSVKMEHIPLKDKNTYYFLVRFQAKEIGMGKNKDVD